ncbi:MAG: DUF5683 domain-containing protein [Candidatus Latescibacteria bacterium]|nr:DUF5683 domain-containing protein [Candidatus Latescibacterota bacterium]
MIRGKTLRGIAAALAAVFVISLAAPASAADSLLLSLLLPGLGQAQDGHYGKASVFGSAALISWTGLFATQVNYSTTVDRYENQKRIYNSYLDQLEGGGTVYAGDISNSYAAMNDAYAQAEDDEKWRNLWIGALIVTYGLNIADILLTGEETGEVQRETDTSLEWRGDSFRLVRTIRF